MAQQLWLLRHGEAEPHGARSDFDRHLTERGEGQARAAGRSLAALEITFRHVFTSPRLRALETARLAGEELGMEPMVHDALEGGFDAGAALELVAAAGEDQRILLVGHEPDFSQIVHDLTGARIDMKKGGVAGVRLDGSRGELIVLVRPRELDRIG